MAPYSAILVSFFAAITVTNGAVHDPMVLMKDLDVPSGSQTKAEYYCPLPKHPQNKNCLIQIPLQDIKCDHEVVPNIQSLRPFKKDRNKKFGFGYQFCTEGGKDGIKSFRKNIYEFLFDIMIQKTLYVDYRILSPHLLTKPELEVNQTQKFEIEHDDYGIDDFKGFNKLIVGHTQEIRKYGKLKQRMLIPPSHMATVWWKKPLYHEVNIKLFRNDMDDYLTHIENYLIGVSIHYGEIRIIAGALDSTHTRDAHVWWKLVYDTSEEYAIAIIIHNVEEVPEGDKKFCDTSICEQYGWHGLILNSSKFIYCCEPNIITERLGFKAVEVFRLGETASREESSIDQGCGEYRQLMNNSSPQIQWVGA